MAKKSLRQRLKDKGWHDDEIEKTVSIVEAAKHKKTSFVKFSEAAVYWIALLLMIIGTFFASVLLIGFQLVFSESFVYVAVAILGLTLGIIFTAIIWEIEHIEAKRYIVEWIFIPAIALINVYIMVALSNHMASLIRQRSLIQNPTIMSAAYVVAFVLPFAAFKAHQHIRNK